MMKFASQLRREAEDDIGENTDQDAKTFDHKFQIEKIMKPDSTSYDKIVISVIDTGIGIKKKDRRKLFKLFGTL